MERDFNSSLRCDSPNLRESEVDQSLVGKVKSIITTPISKWFRKQDDEGKISRRRDDEHEDMLQMEPPSKKVKLPNDIHENSCNNVTSKKLSQNDVRNLAAAPEPVAGPSGIKCRRTLNAHTSFTTETVNGNAKDSDSEDSTSGYSSVVRIGSREQVCQSVDSSKRPSPTQHPVAATTNRRTLFPSAAVNRTLFPDRTGSPHMNTSLSSRRPSFNVSTFGSPNFVDKTLSTKRILNSPFYSGKTVYGGASAYGRKLGRTDQDLKSNLKNSIDIKPVNQQEESNNLILGKTARRILETLEQYSSPISDAKKIPVTSNKPKGLLSKYVGANPYLVREKGALHKELQVPTVTDLLKLKQKTRLQDSTEAVRQIAKASKSNLNCESYKLTVNEEEKEKHMGKMRTKISLVRQRTQIDDSPVPEVNLKPVSLPITTLPKFDLVVPPPATTTASSSPTVTKPSKKVATERVEKSKMEFKFSDPLIIAENLKCIIAMNNFKFSEPLSKKLHDASNKATLNFKMPENKAPVVVPNKAKNNGETAVRAAPALLKTGSVMDILGKKDDSLVERFKPAKDTWECSACLIRNSSDKTKCAACETSRTKKPAENKNDFGSQFKITLDKWECTICLVRNSNLDAKCVSCTAPKPSDIVNSCGTKPLPSNFGDKNNTWECPVCKMQNKSDVTKCTACAGFGSQFKPAADTWECPSCMLRNKEDVNKCAACETSKNQSAKSFDSTFKCKEDEWECGVCMVRNKDSQSKCQCCEAARPGGLGKENCDQKTPIAVFNFGIDKAAATSFSFGIPPSAQQNHVSKPDPEPSTIFGKVISSDEPPTFTFGAPSSKVETSESEKAAVTNPLLKPNEKLPDKAEPAPPGFSFGVKPVTTAASDKQVESAPKTTTTSTSSDASKLMFKFSAPPSTTTALFGNKPDANQKNSALMFSFGSKTSSTPETTTSSSQPVQSVPSFSFGSANKSVANVPAATTTTNTGNVFGSSGSAGAKTFQFGASSSPAPSGGPAQKAAMFQFGQSASTTVTAAPSASAPGAGFNFEPKSAPAPAAAPSFNFSSAQTSPGFNFGQATAAVTAQQPQKKAGFNFGQTAPQQQQGAEFKFGAGTPSGGFNFSSAHPTFDVNAKPTFNFTGGNLPSFTAQPQGDGGAVAGAAAPRKIKRAVRRTQR